VADHGPFQTAKRCRKCDEVKPLAEFTRDRDKPDGRRNECRDCKHAAAKLHRDTNRDVINAKTARWRKAHLDRSRGDAMRNYERTRQAVLDHYGRQCACCGSTTRLHIDHVNGDGGVHREELFGDSGGGGGGAFYRWLVGNGFPAGFQTLCERCNRSKGRGERCVIDHDRVRVAGVRYAPQTSRSKPWVARFGRTHLGLFRTAEEAIAARREAELRDARKAA